jgi:two-component system sensor histidine kinase and response regulator WspE
VPAPTEESSSALVSTRSANAQSRPAAKNADAATDPNKRVLRVAAQSIDRLMGLAGESLVEARRVASFAKMIDRMRKQQAALTHALDELEREVSGSAAGKRLTSEAKERAKACAELFMGHSAEIDSYSRRAEELSERLYREALKSRMRPFGDGTHAFPRLVRDLAKQLGKQVRFDIVGSQTEVDRDVLESLEAPLNHLLRNALDHGLEGADERRQVGKPEQGTLRLEARHHAGVLAIVVADDGRGIDPEKIRNRAVERGLVNANLAATMSRSELLEFLFLPGFTTASTVTDVSGRGIGLDVVKSMVEAVAGTVRVTTEVTKGTIFHLQLPVTRSVARALVADIAGEKYAFPLLRIERVLRVPVADVRLLENRQYFILDDANVALIDARQLLGADRAAGGKDTLSVVVIGERAQRFGIIVDDFAGEHDLVVRPLDARLGKVQDVAAAAILADGSPALIVDVEDMLRSIDRALRSGILVNVGKTAAAAEQVVKKRILVVDDSITVREAERQLLVSRGYEVDVALDGIDALNAIRRTRYDLIISDIDMPRLNGIELVKTIKQDSSLKDIPIVIVSYKDRSEDRLRGLEAGANYYLTKSSFHDEKLVEAVTDLIGEAAA